MKKTLLALALALSASFAQATPIITLFDLLGGGSIQAADKLFTDWTVSFNPTGYSSDPQRTLDPSNIIVTPLTDGDLLNPGPGLKFQVNNNELSVTGVDGNLDGSLGYIDFTLGFKVKVQDPTLQIKDNSLRLTAGSMNWDPTDSEEDLGMFILENIGTAAGSDNLGTKRVEFSQLAGDGTTNFDDSASFAPQDEIWVTKNIYVWADADTDTATLQGFEQRFSQTARVVPEPGSLALLTLALAGLGFARRRVS